MVCAIQITDHSGATSWYGLAGSREEYPTRARAAKVVGHLKARAWRAKQTKLFKVVTLDMQAEARNRVIDECIAALGPSHGRAQAILNSLKSPTIKQA